MNLSIPLYIEEHRVPQQGGSQFILRPLFFASPRESDARLSVGMSRLAREVRRELDALAGLPRHEALIPWTFSGPLADQTIEFNLTLRRQSTPCRLLIVSLEAFDRRFAFVPALPGLWFELARGQTPAERARDEITRHLRAREREESDDFTIPQSLATLSRAWLTPLEIDLHPRPRLPALEERGLLSLISQQAPDGREALAQVGRCLDWLYPDELDRAALRDREADELIRLLDEPRRRPVLLLGPPRVGKTAIIHEAVWRRVHQRKSPYIARQNLWLLSPPRLISGMSHIGQWESRVLSIFDQARLRDHVLYFEDLLGLYHAGVSADSDLNVAAVMRPWIERRDFRLLAEMTPAAFRILQERDRGLADQFHVLPVREPPQTDTRRILIHTLRRAEATHQCRFDLQALPAVMDLQQRYVREQAMPGKAAAFLMQLALKHRQRDITRADALGEFSARSGLSVGFLDASARLARHDIVQSLSRMIIGQHEAVAALADVVAIAKARLNDPLRPLGTFLLLGPTGVGKTQCAKALAQYLYGDESRLLRFDMNEHLDAASIARLVGTFERPEGLLTSALRRQPYCVLLLDEIEKAHPAVLDLLLQALGEGRLTDALGRTSDLTSAIIIMTSNLGAREAQSAFGLRPAANSTRDVFIDAARGFFRPEFFNRIDRIVPFAPLERGDVAAIAARLIAGLFRREGLVHRRCVLAVEPAAMDRIVQQGYHPQLGARALKRAIERQLTAPLADRLATLTPDVPTLITIHPAGEAVVPHLQPLVSAAAIPPAVDRLDLADPDPLLTRIERFLNEVESANPGRGDGRSAPVSADALSPEHFRYFAIREQINRIDRIIQDIDHAADAAAARKGRAPRMLGQRTFRARATRRIARLNRPASEFASLMAAQDFRAHIARMAESATPVDAIATDRLWDLLFECAILYALDRSAPGADRILLEVRTLGGDQSHPLARDLCNAYARLFGTRYGFSAQVIPERLDPACEFIIMEMPAIAAIMQVEHGTHLACPPHQNIVPIQLNLIPLRENDAPGDIARAHLARRSAWRGAVAAGQASPDQDPTPLLPVLRLYDPTEATIDLRTGLLCPNMPAESELRQFIIAALPLPDRLLDPERSAPGARLP